MPSDWDDYTLDIRLLKHYQSIIGVLIWTTLRFDVAYHISVLTQYTTRPTEKLVKEAYRVMGYLVGTPHFNICYKTPELRNRIHAALGTIFAERSTYKEKSTRTLDLLQQWTYRAWSVDLPYDRALSTTQDSSIHNRPELDSFVSYVRYDFDMYKQHEPEKLKNQACRPQD
jgi:hypothetical protein